MCKRKFLIFVSLLLVLVALSWGIDQVWAQQAPKKNAPALQSQGQPNSTEMQEEAAAVRRYYGLPRNTTNAERRAAAQRNAERRAAAALQGKKGGTK